MASQPTSMRRARERDLVRATRALFDERGLQDAPIEEIARAVGIARGLIYRQFSSKEELYVLTVTDYLAELDGLLGEATSAELEAVAKGAAGRARARRAARGVGPRLRRLLPALSGVPGLRAVAHASAGGGAARGAVGVGVAAPGARDRQLRGPRVRDPARRRSRRDVRRRGPGLHGQRPVDPGPRRHPPGPHPRRSAAARPRHPRALHGGSRALGGHLRGQRAGDRRRPVVKLGRVEPQLRSVAATRYVEPLREGGSLPGLMEADDDGLYVAKYTGAGQGPAALVAEVVVGELARRLGLPVPELVTLALPAELARAEPDAEIQDLLRASAGVNLGVDFLPGSLPFTPAAVAEMDPELAADVVWLDALTTNVDRTPRNPNLLVWHGRTWLIDHGAALFRQHGW